MDNKTINIKFVKENEFITVPERKTEGAACYDIKATGVKYDDEKDCYVYHTGLKVEIPKGYCIKIYPRSSNRNKECYLPNSVGIIDSDYRGEILVSYKDRCPLIIISTIKCIKFWVNKILNKLNYEHQIAKMPKFSSPYEIGDNIAQLEVVPTYNIEWQEVDKLSETKRGEGGHGSTGK